MPKSLLVDRGSAPRMFPMTPHPAAPRRIAIVVPVYNDWTCFGALLGAIDASLARGSVRCRVFAVDDASSRAPGVLVDGKPFARVDQVEVIRLACNLGHQRAIAVGLAVVDEVADLEGVVVMDADGEDRPEDILRLIAAAEEHPGEIVCAQRVRRSESPLFVGFYSLYKLAFRSFSGQRIDFGNYCYIPRAALHGLICNPAVWNHLAASIVRSRIPFRRIDTARGRRYGGRSSMNFQSLLLHGLSAISVYSDVVLVRLLVATSFMAMAALAGIVAVAAIRLFTSLAIPGWATNAAGLLLIFLMQSLIFAAISTFMLLGARTAKPILPATDALQYVCRRDTILPGAPS